MRTSGKHSPRLESHRETLSVTRRFTRVLGLALYMTDPIRLDADPRLVAEYLGEEEATASRSTQQIA
jgi:hypothetical protein